ncbi:MAG: hypothetical protein KGZ74_08045 [Chitinophagaceae bacterium]|nr:hypothetical protein [Chitinophagaceae bacterium]
MSGIVAFDDLFPLKPVPTTLDRVFGFDSGDGKSRGFTIQSILDLIAETPVTWGEIDGKPTTFAPAAHSLGSHSNVASSVDSAADGTFIKRVGGQYQAVAVDFYGVSNPPPADATVPDAVRGITATQIAQWNSAYGWGNHAGQYLPISYVPSWGEIDGKPTTFAPAAHTLASHSDTTALATATEGQLVRKAAVGFEAFTADYYSPFNPPPPDATVPDFVRDFTIGQFAGYEEKMLEFADLPDGAVPLIKDGIPQDSQLKGVYSVNPFDPETEPVEYDAFVSELLHLISTKRIKGPDAVDSDDYATLGQVPVLFDDDLDAIAGANAPSALNPFATMDDLFSRSIFDLLQDGATDGQAVVWSAANNRWQPGTVAGGGGADTNAVHYNAADGKNKTEKAQARTNIGATDGSPQIIATNGTIPNLNYTSNLLIFTGSNVTLNGLQSGQIGEEVTIVNSTDAVMTLPFNSAGVPGDNFTGTFQIPRGGILVLKRINTGLSNGWFQVGSNLLHNQVIGFSQALNSLRLHRIFVGIDPTTAAWNIVRPPDGSSPGAPIMRFQDASNVGQVDITQGGTIQARSRIWVGIPIGSSPGTSAYSFIRPENNSAPPLIVQTATPDNIAVFNIDRTITQGARSTASDRLIRRDEMALLYPVTVTTAGTINDQAETAGNFNYYFTAATQINGFASGENGKVKVIHNNNTVDCILAHENAGSIAANRINLIGAADLTIPVGGVVELIYLTTISRWRLKSKNF